MPFASSSGVAPMPDVHLLEHRAPARFHARSSSLAGALLPDEQHGPELPRRHGRATARPFAHAGSSSACRETPASDVLAEAARCMCCRSRRDDHVSVVCRAAVELSECLQVRADKQIWPCRHPSQNCSRCNFVNVRFRQGDSRAPASNTAVSLCLSSDRMLHLQRRRRCKRVTAERLPYLRGLIHEDYACRIVFEGTVTAEHGSGRTVLWLKRALSRSCQLEIP